MSTEIMEQPASVETAEAKPGSLHPAGYAFAHVLSTRLAKIESEILDAKVPRDVEREIVWRLFGTVSFCLRKSHASATERRHANWLLSEIESTLNDRRKRTTHNVRISDDAP